MTKKMDDATKNAILAHIDKIEQFARQPGNEWLLMELMQRFGPDKKMAEIKRIEKYLALDYAIDAVAAGISYSFVDDVVLKAKLTSDWREMLRYRCGVRNHKIDFDEFCKFAHFQAEGMINYYHFQRRMSDECDVDWFNANIDAYNQKCKKDTKEGKTPFFINPIPTTTPHLKLAQVDYQKKLCVLLNYMEDVACLSAKERKGLSIGLNEIRDNRYKQSHRDVAQPSLLALEDFDKVERTLLFLHQKVEQIISHKI